MKQTEFFYNTVQLAEPALLAEQVKNKAQEELVQEIYQHINAPMTPFDVQRILEVKGSKIPITSVRRAITNLAKKGVLEKSGCFRNGDYHVRNNMWKLKL